MFGYEDSFVQLIPATAPSFTLCATAKLIFWRCLTRQIVAPKREVRYFKVLSQVGDNEVLRGL